MLDGLIADEYDREELYNRLDEAFDIIDLAGVSKSNLLALAVFIEGLACPIDTPFHRSARASLRLV